MSEIKTTIRTVHTDSSKKLEEFITARIQKLAKLTDNIIESEVFIKQNNHSVDNKEVEIKLIIPGYDLFAAKSAKTFEEATDLVVEALRRQLKKRKDKVWNA